METVHAKDSGSQETESKTTLKISTICAAKSLQQTLFKCYSKLIIEIGDFNFSRKIMVL